MLLIVLILQDMQLKHQVQSDIAQNVLTIALLAQKELPQLNAVPAQEHIS
jgi:hypothetical protein